MHCSQSLMLPSLQLTAVMFDAFTNQGVRVITENLFFDSPPAGETQIFADLIQQLNVNSSSLLQQRLHDLTHTHAFYLTRTHALYLTRTHALYLTRTHALYLTCTHALYLTCTHALYLTCTHALYLICTHALYLTCTHALYLTRTHALLNPCRLLVLV